jgi:hypothetical protein
MVTKVWTKPQTQETLKQLRAGGFSVVKIPSGYEAFDGMELVFKAMNGMRGYLVRHKEGLFKYNN